MFLETNSNSHAEACPRCHHREMKSIDIREELVRLAEQQSCKVEVVNESNQLKEIGGIGCLLRYWLPDYEQWIL
jgi:peptide subunit release factor 1 (eRF1)